MFKAFVILTILSITSCATNKSYVMRGNTIHARCTTQNDCHEMARFMCPYTYKYRAQKILTVNKFKNDSYYVSDIKCILK